MNVLLRADSGAAIGAGHVMRCLAVADGLAAAGARCRFVCRAHEGALVEPIRRAGHDLELLPLEVPEGSEEGHAAWVGASAAADGEACARLAREFGAAWVLVDHYGLDARWERRVAAAGARIAAVDDLADRAHDCALLIDTTPGRRCEDYVPWVPADCELQLGAEHALLRPEFAARRAEALARRRPVAVRHLFVSMGGMDSEGSAVRVLAAAETAFGADGPRITVVVGAQSPTRDAVEAQAAAMAGRVDVLCGVDDMASLMIDADLAVGGAGTTSWERCCLGLPTITVVLAANQKLIAERLAEAGAAHVLEANVADDGFEATLARLLRTLAEAPEQRARMSARAAALVDGRGVARLVNTLRAGSTACPSP